LWNAPVRQRPIVSPQRGRQTLAHRASGGIRDRSNFRKPRPGRHNHNLHPGPTFRKRAKAAGHVCRPTGACQRVGRQFPVTQRWPPWAKLCRPPAVGSPRPIISRFRFDTTRNLIVRCTSGLRLTIDRRSSPLLAISKDAGVSDQWLVVRKRVAEIGADAGYPLAVILAPWTSNRTMRFILDTQAKLEASAQMHDERLARIEAAVEANTGRSGGTLSCSP
jgi:hypothetical protein